MNQFDPPVESPPPPSSTPSAALTFAAAIDRAATALTRAELVAQINPAGSEALCGVAAGWTDLAHTLESAK